MMKRENFILECTTQRNRFFMQNKTNVLIRKLNPYGNRIFHFYLFAAQVHAHVHESSIPPWVSILANTKWGIFKELHICTIFRPYIL